MSVSALPWGSAWRLWGAPALLAACAVLGTVHLISVWSTGGLASSPSGVPLHLSQWLTSSSLFSVPLPPHVWGGVGDTLLLPVSCWPSVRGARWQVQQLHLLLPGHPHPPRQSHRVGPEARTEGREERGLRLAVTGTVIMTMATDNQGHAQTVTHFMSQQLYGPGTVYLHFIKDRIGHSVAI